MALTFDTNHFTDSEDYQYLFQELSPEFLKSPDSEFVMTLMSTLNDLTLFDMMLHKLQRQSFTAVSNSKGHGPTIGEVLLQAQVFLLMRNQLCVLNRAFDLVANRFQNHPALVGLCNFEKTFQHRIQSLRDSKIPDCLNVLEQQMQLSEQHALTVRSELTQPTWTVDKEVSGYHWYELANNAYVLYFNKHIVPKESAQLLNDFKLDLVSLIRAIVNSAIASHVLQYEPVSEAIDLDALPHNVIDMKNFVKKH